MNTQITIDQIHMDQIHSDPESIEEEAYLSSQLPKMKDALEQLGVDSNLLRIAPSSNYTALYFHNFTCFRIRLRKLAHYILLPILFFDLIPDHIPAKQDGTYKKYMRLPINWEHPLESYSDFLVTIVEESINRYPKEYDCCSRYLECSDAAHCIHPDKTFALACGYQKILKSGRIFYGKNRNID